MTFTETSITSVPVGKGYFHTCDVYRWKGDVNSEGEDVNYDNLRDEYGDDIHDELNTEEYGEYVQPHNEFPYETRTLEQWLLEQYGEMSQKNPLLVKMWARRYADVKTDDNWETYYSEEYGGGDWGSDEYLIYNGEILSEDIRQKLEEKVIFPHPYIGG